MKLLIREPESAEAARLWNAADTVASSRLLYVEARAAFAVVRRAQRQRRHRDRLDELVEHVEFVEFEPRTAWLAGEVAERHRLRANDAIHLASALELADAELVLAAWDVDLRRAAREAGLRLAPSRVERG